MNVTRSGTALVLTLAGLFATDALAKAPEKEAQATVMCAGINGCKGQSACSTAQSSCKGQNACKGKGWLPVATAKECTDKGGTVMTPPAPAPAPAKVH